MGRLIYHVHFLIQFLAIFHVEANLSDNLIVETSIGSIRGVRADDGNYTMFLGIPYAKVNKTNIFGESIPQAPFDEIFEANTETTKCPQIEEFNSTAVGDLDCLQLNVYVPDVAKATPSLLPVMVYFYGGFFTAGYSERSYLGPKYLVQQDVILVTLNNRVGVYGFVCLDSPDVPGNAGLKDQVTALRWVHNHIKSFGGDPQQVTVFGNSAGGKTIGLHIASENEKLFKNAIIQSGSVFAGGTVSNKGNSDSVLALTKALNFTTDDVDEALAFIASVDVLTVVETVNKNSISFPVCVEKEYPGVERFLSKHPLNADNSKVDGMNIIIGNNRNESTGHFLGKERNSDPAKWPNLISNFVNTSFNFDDEELYSATYDIIRHFYIGDAEFNSDVRDDMIHFYDDYRFVHPSMRSIQAYLNAGAAKVYRYVFSYDGGRNFVKAKNGWKFNGTSHADELGYLWDVHMLPKPTELDQMMINRVTTLWANFAKYDDPTPETTLLLPVDWQPIVKGSPYHHLDINVEMASGKRFEHQRMTFWDMIYKAFGQYERARSVPVQT
ncbi:carboxylesterase family domain-containing protein [Phthorimaea operculella]|nr:carboxylesterase family domain-containing protein [Phthorimaea operculella]